METGKVDSHLPSANKRQRINPVDRLIQRLDRTGNFLSWVQTDLDEMTFCDAEPGVMLELLAEYVGQVLRHRYSIEERTKAWEVATENTLLSIVLKQSRAQQ